MRCAIYARYSTDLQREASIEDQVRVCRERINREGWHLVTTYADRAISGTNRLRPGYQALFEGARAGQFDVIVAEALDRISRDQEDIAAFYKRFSFMGIKILTLAEGEVSELHVGLKGTMNALFLKDLADKIRRGQRGRIAVGRSPGGLPYGYEVICELAPDGQPERGKRRINEQQAQIVRRIFESYVAGASPRAIATQLNSEGVRAPRGGSWNASTINGNRRRRDGILWNELYIGRLIYNRQRFTKDPETGRRVPKPNSQKDWVIAEAPDLRIIEQSLWDRTRAFKAKAGSKNPQNLRRPKRLLSGLIRCGVCGGSYTVIGEERMGCAVHREKGTCQNGKTITIAKLENRVLNGLKEQLLAPDLIAEFAREYQRQINHRERDRSISISLAKNEAREIDGRINRIVDAIEQGAEFAELRERLANLEKRRVELQQTLDGDVGEDHVIHICPDLSGMYQRKVAELRDALNKDLETRQQAIAILRTLIDKIVLHPGAKRGEFKVELMGQLASIINLARPQGPGEEVMITMVAEEGLEPPTRGL